MRRRLSLPLACLCAALFAAILGACQNPTANVASTHKITFNANGGSGAMAALSVAEDAEVALTANAFTKDAYSFIGWARYPLATGAEYPDKASFTMGSSSVALYAVWATTGTPHIVVSGPVSLGDTIVVSMPYVSGKSSYGFGQIYGTGETTSASVSLTISNTGTAPLILSGSSPYVTISANSDNSAWLSQLSIPTPPKQTIPAGESAKCVIRLAGVSWTDIGGRDYTATVTISSNDPDEPDFTLSLTGNIGC
jgi:hypothetical protein